MGVEEVADISVSEMVLGVGAYFNDVVGSELCCLGGEELPVVLTALRCLDDVDTPVNCFRNLVGDWKALLGVCDNQYIHLLGGFLVLLYWCAGLQFFIT